MGVEDKSVFNALIEFRGTGEAYKSSGRFAVSLINYIEEQFGEDVWDKASVLIGPPIEPTDNQIASAYSHVMDMATEQMRLTATRPPSLCGFINKNNTVQAVYGALLFVRRNIALDEELGLSEEITVH